DGEEKCAQTEDLIFCESTELVVDDSGTSDTSNVEAESSELLAFAIS
ncbi:10152_t:CDS:2, partial [Cetraspora pellucida]